jgi:hypothetical protein
LKHATINSESNWSITIGQRAIRIPAAESCELIVLIKRTFISFAGESRYRMILPLCLLVPLESQLVSFFPFGDSDRAVREVRLNSDWEIPTVEVVLGNGLRRTIRASLVFDTGAGLTQLDAGLVKSLDYSAIDAVATRRVVYGVKVAPFFSKEKKSEALNPLAGSKTSG